MTGSGRQTWDPTLKFLAAAALVLALTGSLARPAQAATRFVATTGNDSSNTCLASGAPCKTITHALTQAVAGDTISVAAGTYNLALGETFPLTITKTLMLTGAGAGSTILDATGANRTVILLFVSGGVAVTISGVTITGGASSCTSSGIFCTASGGGLGNEFGGTLSLTNSTVSGNTVNCTASALGFCTASGGGLSGGGTITNSTVGGNTVSCAAIGKTASCTAEGGGLSGGTVTLTNSTVGGNTVSCTASEFDCSVRGGGLSGGTVTLTNSTVSGNTVNCNRSGNGSCAFGGGLSGGTVTLTNSTVSGNTVNCTGSGSPGECGADGGGLFGSATLMSSTVSGNMASCTANAGGFTCHSEGGGIGNEFGGTFALTNSTVSGNTASCAKSGGGFCGASGGGISFGGGTLTLTNATVTANMVTCSGAAPCPAGGGGLLGDGTTTLQNTIIAKQLAGHDCSLETITSNGFNLASDNTCQLTQPSDKPNVSTPLLGPLQNNGGPTQTHALLPGSPAIDGGTNAGCPATDQRGFRRPVDGNGDATATCDIGAYELVVVATTLAAAVLPTERTGLVGGPAITAFATILNTGAATALGCALAPFSPPVAATFLYQTTDAQNALTGTANIPVAIPPGQGQSFVFAFTPTAPFPPTEVQLSFACTNSAPAPILPGVDTFRLRASATPAPDLVALAATLKNDGIVRLASTGVFAVATVNLGAPGLITVSADTGGVALPVTILLCETNPQTGQCLAPPTPTVQTQVDSGATPTFGIFATNTAPIPFDPATNRIQVHIEGGGGGGGTSVAVCSVPLCP